jgi:integrase
VFPSFSNSGHFNQGKAKKQHAKALKDSGVKRFEPYTLRHTALTNFGKHCDAYTPARIAGHSSISITQRYIHSQADAIEMAFEKMAISGKLVTEGGHQENKNSKDGIVKLRIY